MDEQTRTLIAAGSTAASLVSLGVAVIAMIGTALANANARNVAKDKMEIEMRTARDKLEFDAKIVKLQVSQDQCVQDHKECKEETDKIRKKLKECEDHHETSVRDREILWAEVEKLKLLPKT